MFQCPRRISQARHVDRTIKKLFIRSNISLSRVEIKDGLFIIDSVDVAERKVKRASYGVLIYYFIALKLRDEK